jgi:transcription initiation factor TFIIIB Brf1 subunit/transcription initiation factor TFIIB
MSPAGAESGNSPQRGDGVLRCVYCGSTRIIRNEFGELVCLDCGSVQPVNVYDGSYEVRDWEKIHRGPPMNFETTGSLTTKIDTTDLIRLSDVRNRLSFAKMAKYQKTIGFSSIDSVINEVKEAISAYNQQLGLSGADVDTVVMCVNKVKQKHGRLPRNMNAVVASCIYVLHKLGKIHSNLSSPQQLCQLFNIRQRTFFRFVDFVNNALNVDTFTLFNINIDELVAKMLSSVSSYLSFSDSVSIGTLKRVVIDIVKRYSKNVTYAQVKKLVAGAIMYLIDNLYSMGKIAIVDDAPYHTLIKSLNTDSESVYTYIKQFRSDPNIEAILRKYGIYISKNTSVLNVNTTINHITKNALKNNESLAYDEERKIENNEGGLPTPIGTLGDYDVPDFGLSKSSRQRRAGKSSDNVLL